ncbi:MAG: hypothetical protein NC320_06020 [Clostridium sp.]|nr:hypothetical protein [Clostridium sp.]
MAEILISNGASRKNGSTSRLIKAFSDGARNLGNEIHEFYLQDMNIKDCLGCEYCSSAKLEKYRRGAWRFNQVI